MTNWTEQESKYFMPVFKRQPIVLVRGEGVWVWDEAGRKYLDFVGGWAVNALGHCHPAIVEALKTQAGELIQVSNQFYTIPQLQLAELLIQNSCMDRVFFSNSGAEANEGAFKLARKYGRLHRHEAYEIITVSGSFHGRTMAGIAATGQHKFQDPFVPLPNGFVNVEYNSIEAIKSATNNMTCAVMLEPIQGESGVNMPDENYFREVRKWCDENDLLLILDEIQTGVGRTGTLFAYEQLDIEPDIMTLAKGLGGGVPIGAILVKEHASVFEPGDHGSTFGGNPLVCAAGHAALKYILENGIPEHVKKVGGYLLGKLDEMKEAFDLITEVRGRGFLCAVQFDREISADVVKACNEQGLLTNAVKPNAIRLMPPLITTRDEVDQAIAILEDVLKQWK
ncbi:MAG: acetylornithine transaminase [Dehalococcoidia bacterium]